MNHMVSPLFKNDLLSYMIIKLVISNIIAFEMKHQKNTVGKNGKEQGITKCEKSFNRRIESNKRNADQ